MVCCVIVPQFKFAANQMKNWILIIVILVLHLPSQAAKPFIHFREEFRTD